VRTRERKKDGALDIFIFYVFYVVILCNVKLNPMGGQFGIDFDFIFVEEEECVS